MSSIVNLLSVRWNVGSRNYKWYLLFGFPLHFIIAYVGSIYLLVWENMNTKDVIISKAQTWFAILFTIN